MIQKTKNRISTVLKPQNSRKAQKSGEVAEPSGGENGDPRRLAEVYNNAAKGSLIPHYYYIPYRHKCQVTIRENSKKLHFFSHFSRFRHYMAICNHENVNLFMVGELFRLEDVSGFV